MSGWCTITARPLQKVDFKRSAQAETYNPIIKCRTKSYVVNGFPSQKHFNAATLRLCHIRGPNKKKKKKTMRNV